MNKVLLVLLLLLTSCAKPVKVQAKVIDIYRTGLALRKTMTVVEMADGSRRQLRGRVGKKGESIWLWIRGDDVSVEKPR